MASKSVIPHAKNITDSNIDKENEPTACSTLYRAASDEHTHAGRRSTDDGANEEDRNGRKNDGLPSPNIGKLRPYRRRCRIGK